jgi:nucleotide-binding universal stress UspA family protein
MSNSRIKCILVPTDFSSAAVHAGHYALKLAARHSSRVILFHAVGIPIMNSAEEVEFITAGEIEKIEHEQLVQLRHLYKKSHPTVEIETHSHTGFAVEEIADFAGKSKADLIVMGTRGATGLKEIMVGSNTANLIGHTEIPVLAVPEQSDYRMLKKIVFATNMLKDDIKSLARIISMFGSEEPEIVLLHIEDGHRRDPEAALLNWFREEVQPHTDYPHLKAETIGETNIVKTLHEYLLKNEVDVLVTATRKRNFIERIFDRSITQRLVFHTSVPLLALHSHGSKGEIVL